MCLCHFCQMRNEASRRFLNFFHRDNVCHWQRVSDSPTLSSCVVAHEHTLFSRWITMMMLASFIVISYTHSAPTTTHKSSESSSFSLWFPSFPSVRSAQAETRTWLKYLTWHERISSLTHILCSDFSIKYRYGCCCGDIYAKSMMEKLFFGCWKTRAGLEGVDDGTRRSESAQLYCVRASAMIQKMFQQFSAFTFPLPLDFILVESIRNPAIFHHEDENKICSSFLLPSNIIEQFFRSFIWNLFDGKMMMSCNELNLTLFLFHAHHRSHTVQMLRLWSTHDFERNQKIESRESSGQIGHIQRTNDCSNSLYSDEK